MDSDGFFGRAALLVDGNGDLTSVLRPMLEARGFEVCVVPSALEALRSVVAKSFDVVVCDLDGFALSRAGFGTALERGCPALAQRCVFVAPFGKEVDPCDPLVCQRPLNMGRILRTISFVASAPVAAEDAVLTQE